MKTRLNKMLLIPAWIIPCMFVCAQEIITIQDFENENYAHTFSNDVIIDGNTYIMSTNGGIARYDVVNDISAFEPMNLGFSAALTRAKDGDYLLVNENILLELNRQLDTLWLNANTTGSAIVSLIDSSIVIGGHFLTKLLNSRGWDWTKSYKAYGLFAGNDSSFFVTYESRILKFDLDGNLIWDNNYAFASSVHELVIEDDNSIYMSGRSYDEREIIIARLNENGDSIWMKNYGFPYPLSGYIERSNVGLGKLQNGLVFGSIDADTDEWIISKIDTNGNILWEQQIPDNYGEGHNDIDIPEDKIAISGTRYINDEIVASLAILRDTTYFFEPIDRMTNRADSVLSRGTGIPWWDLRDRSIAVGRNIITEVCSNNSSDTLILNHFNFNVPAHATIKGIALKIVRSGSHSNELRDEIISLYHNGIIGNNKSSFGFWPHDTLAREFLYGGDNDLWATNLTPTLVNDSSFGILIKTLPTQQFCIGVHIDYVEMSITYLDSLSLSTTDVIQQTQLFRPKIYPNPTSNQLTISEELPMDEVNIFDITGKTVKTVTTNFDQISVIDLPSGIYFVEIVGEEETVVQKLVKQ